MTERRRVGVFGGSFDPPHICHLLLAVTALELGDLHEVWWVPLLHHAFGTKRPAAFEDRAEMVSRLIAPYAPRMRMDPIEARRGGTSYTVDTVRALRAAHPDADLRLVVGADLVAEVPRWREHRALLEMAPLVVVGRQGAEAASASAPGGTRWLPVTLPDVSSSALRARVAAGEDVGDAVPRRVREVIAARGLYLGRGADPGADGAAR